MKNEYSPYNFAIYCFPKEFQLGSWELEENRSLLMEIQIIHILRRDGPAREAVKAAAARGLLVRRSDGELRSRPWERMGSKESMIVHVRYTYELQKSIIST